MAATIVCSFICQFICLLVLWFVGFSHWDCCLRRYCLRVCLNFLWLLMFLISVGIEFHALVLRSVMCDIEWVVVLVLNVEWAGM